MRIRFTINLTHWMIGFSFGGDCTALFSIGPLNMWVMNERRLKRKMEKMLLKGGFDYEGD